MEDPGRRCDYITGSNLVTLTHSLHANNLLCALNDSRRNPGLCDGIVIIGADEIPIQKNVLVAASPYFRALYNYEGPENTTSSPPKKHIIAMDDLTKEVFQLILDYIYTSKISLCEENIQDILQAADILLLKDLKELCCDYLEECIAVHNCLGIQDFAERYACPRVQYLATEYLDQHFREISYSEEFLQLSASKVTEVLKRECLNIQTEDAMFDSVLRWVEYNVEERLHCFQTVLSSSVLLSMLSDPYFETVVLTNGLIQRLGIQGQLVAERSHGNHNPILPRGYTEVIVIAGGQRDRLRTFDRHPDPADADVYTISDKVFCISPQDRITPVWIELGHMITARMGHGLIQAGGYLYAVGGRDTIGQVLNTAELYDPVLNTWQLIAPMSHARVGFGLVAVEDRIFALGGSNDMSDPLISIEEYNIYSNKWRQLPDMGLKRAWSAYAVIGKKIFVIGGGIMGKLYESVESFDTKSETWSTVAPMKERRFDARAVGVDNLIYVFGGLRRFECPSAMHTGNNMKFCNTEMYTEDKKLWYSVNGSREGLCTMKESSHIDGAVHINDEVLVLGELDMGHIYHCIRGFQPSTNTWRCVMTTPPAQLHYMQCAKLKLSNAIIYKHVCAQNQGNSKGTTNKVSLLATKQ